MLQLPSRRFSTFEIAVASAAMVGFTYFLSSHRVKRALNPMLSWFKTKVLLRPTDIIIVNSREECSNVIKTILRDCHELRFVGFDCEWVPNTVKGCQRNPVALLQIATPKGTCALFRLSKIGFLPEDVKVLLRDPSLLKVGVSTQSDAHLLHQDHNALVKGCLDLRMLCESESGLARLAHTVLGVNMDKHWKISCSNWAAENLSYEQTMYAANDALASALIFSKVTGLHHDSLIKLKRTNKSWQEVATTCSSLLDTAPKRRHVVTSVSKNVHRHVTVMQKRPNARSFGTVSKPIYDNCMLLAPDGEILATCQKSKAEWYLSNGLAEKVENITDEAALTVKLLFEPKDRTGKDGRNYYATIKQNICVVCGSEENHVRRCIVPREYKIYFPEKEKDHKSHDVLVLCLSCNIRLDSVQLTMRRTLAESCNAPIASKQHAPFINDPQLNKVKSAGRALTKSAEHVEKIPLEKRMELKRTIAAHFEIEENELLERHIFDASELNPSAENEDYQSHGFLVVKHFEEVENTANGIFKLEQMWRSHFLQHMRPKFLPDQWSVTHQQ